MKIRKSLLVLPVLLAALMAILMLPRHHAASQPTDKPEPETDQKGAVAEQAPEPQPVTAQDPAPQEPVAAAPKDQAADDPAKGQRDQILTAMGFGTSGGHSLAVQEKNAHAK